MSRENLMHEDPEPFDLYCWTFTSPGMCQPSFPIVAST